MCCVFDRVYCHNFRPQIRYLLSNLIAFVGFKSNTLDTTEVSVAVAVVVGDMGMSLGVTGNAMRLSRITPERFR
jgi:hypothetical protein